MSQISASCRAPSDRDTPDERAAYMELRASSYAALRDVCCCCDSGRIVLCGRVPSYYHKQIAQCLLLKRFGRDFPLDNRLEVVPQVRERLWSLESSVV